MDNQKEIGRISLSKFDDIIVSVGTFRNKERVDIRKFTKGEKYTGYTKQGISIPKEKWQELKKILDKV